MTTNREAGPTGQETPTERPTPPKRATAAARKPRVGEGKARSKKKPSACRKRVKSQKPTNSSASREGSKTAKILDLLKRPKGASLNELMKATGWQPHSVRGFLSGTISKRMGLALTSTKGDAGERSYSVKD